MIDLRGKCEDLRILRHSGCVYVKNGFSGCVNDLLKLYVDENPIDHMRIDVDAFGREFVVFSFYDSISGEFVEKAWDVYAHYVSVHETKKLHERQPEFSDLIAIQFCFFTFRDYDIRNCVYNLEEVR